MFSARPVMLCAKIILQNYVLYRVTPQKPKSFLSNLLKSEKHKHLYLPPSKDGPASSIPGSPRYLSSLVERATPRKNWH